MTGVAGLTWVVQVINASHRYRLGRFGLRPRHVDGLWGVLTEPWLHHSYGHALSDTIPLVGVGWVLLLSGPRVWATVSAAVLVVGGAAQWLVAPAGLIVGSSPLVFGWMGYLLARAYFARKLAWILVAVAVLFFFGTLLGNLLPSYNSAVPWQANVCGFVAGVAAGAVLHPRRRRGGPGSAGRAGLSVS